MIFHTFTLFSPANALVLVIGIGRNSLRSSVEMLLELCESLSYRKITGAHWSKCSSNSRAKVPLAIIAVRIIMTFIEPNISWVCLLETLCLYVPMAAPIISYSVIPVIIGTRANSPRCSNSVGWSAKNRSCPKSGSITGFHKIIGFSPANSNILSRVSAKLWAGACKMC